jgi:hypothetical protein
MERGSGREGEARLKLSGSERKVFTVVKGFYTLITRSLRARSGVFGKPGVSGLKPGYSAPLEIGEQIIKEFGFA